VDTSKHYVIQLQEENERLKMQVQYLSWLIELLQEIIRDDDA